MELSDEALLCRWMEFRDPEAFHELVERHAGTVMAVCRRVLGNAHDAEEITQDVFLTLAQGRSRIRKSVGGWLYRCATSRALDRLRSDGRRRRREDAIIDEHARTGDPAWNEILHYVDEAIADLPEALREPLVRHFLLRQSHETIARDLKLSRSAVTHRIAKGLERVRRSLQKRGVKVGAAALSAVLSANLSVAAALPPALSVTLGKAALAGVLPSRMLAAVGWGSGVKTVAALITACVAVYAMWTILPREEHSRGTHGGVPASSDAIGQVNLGLARTKPASPSPAQNHSTLGSGTERRDGSLSGQILVDYAKNASNRDERPLSPMVVPLADIPVDISNREKGLVLTVRTDAKGRYSADGLPAGGYSLVCRPHLTPSAYGQRDWFMAVKADAPNAVRDVHFERGTYIRGHIRDSHNKPIEGAHLLGQAQGEFEPQETESEALSGIDGMYTLPHVRRGTDYQLKVDAGPKGSLRALVPVPLDGEADGVDFVMEADASVAGRVVDSQGRAFPNLTVSLAHYLPPAAPGEEEKEWVLYDLPGPVKSTLNGAFAFDGLTAAAYVVQYSLDDNEPRDWVTAGEPFTLGHGDRLTNRLVVVAVPTKGAGGTVEGVVVDESGAPLPNIDVFHIEQTQLPPYERRVNGKTDASGRFSVTDLTGETVDLEFQHFLDLGSSRHLTQGYAATHVGHREWDVPAGTNDLRIVLSAIGSISGTVLDVRTGQPIPVGGVVPLGDTPKGHCFLDVTKAAPHQFRFCGLGPGTHDVLVKSPDYVPTMLPNVEVHPGRDTGGLVARLEPAGALEGRVQLRGEPARNGKAWVVAVPLHGSGQPSDILVGAVGRYSDSNFAPGRYRLFAYCNADGAVVRSAPAEVVIAVGKTARQDFDLRESGAIEGAVTAAPDAGWIQVQLVTPDADIEAVRPWRTDYPQADPLASAAFPAACVDCPSDGGTFAIHHLPPGTYTAVALALHRRHGEPTVLARTVATIVIIDGQASTVSLAF